MSAADRDAAVTDETEDCPRTVPRPLRASSTPVRSLAHSSPWPQSQDPVVVNLTETVSAAREEASLGVEPRLPDAAGDAYKAKLAISIADRTKNMNTLDEIAPSTTQSLAAMDNYYVSISDPRDSSVRGAKPPSRFLEPYRVVRTIHTQVTAFLVYLVCVMMVLVQCFGGGGNTHWFTFLATAVFAVEMVVLLSFQGLSCRLALWNRYWRLGEPIFLAVGFILEVAAWAVYGAKERRGGLTALAWLRLLLYWLPHGKTRWEQLQYGVRTLCSADRRRYLGEAYDLDCAYVHRNLAAMGWPAYNYERFFRNAMEDVVGFLDRKHPNAYLVVNLCSERTYSPSFFHHQTSWYPLDDHNPAELEMMLAFSREAADFVSEDPNSRAVVVHCKGGKGRTGTLCCAYLMFTGLKRNADDALRHFSLLRTRDGASSFQGVQAPSQERYVRYFERLLQEPNLIPPSRSLRVNGLRLNSIPWLWYTQGVGKLWFVILGKPCTERQILFLSNEDVEFSSCVPDPSTYTKKQFRDLWGTDEDNLYKQCNAMDADPLRHYTNDVGVHPYKLDTTSFWFMVNGDRSRKLSYEEFYQTYGNNFSPLKRADGDGGHDSASVVSVSLEFREPERIPLLSGDVVFKFFFARTNPNPLEPPVQFWLHPSFETDSVIKLDRSQLDGPPKDKKAARYPLDFGMELDVEYLVSKRE